MQPLAFRRVSCAFADVFCFELQTKQREYPDDRDSSRPRAMDHQHPALAGIDGYTHEPGSQNAHQQQLLPENEQRSQGRDQQDQKRQDLLAEERVGFDSYADGGDSHEVSSPITHCTYSSNAGLTEQYGSLVTSPFPERLHMSHYSCSA